MRSTNIVVMLACLAGLFGSVAVHSGCSAEMDTGEEAPAEVEYRGDPVIREPGWNECGNPGQGTTCYCIESALCGAWYANPTCTCNSCSGYRHGTCYNGLKLCKLNGVWWCGHPAGGAAGGTCT